MYIYQMKYLCKLCTYLAFHKFQVMLQRTFSLYPLQMSRKSLHNQQTGRRHLALINPTMTLVCDTDASQYLFLNVDLIFIQDSTLSPSRAKPSKTFYGKNGKAWKNNSGLRHPQTWRPAHFRFRRPLHLISSSFFNLHQEICRTFYSRLYL